VKKALQEGALVAVIGATLAFVANGLSPHRLELTRDNFPYKLTTPPPGASTNLTGTATATTNSPLELLAASLRANGLQLADSNQVMQLFRDPRRERDEVIFIDARADEPYQAGHIPGAYHFYRFPPEKYLTNVLQVCLTAQQIVFYCNGGDCDESEHTAIFLRDSIPIPKEKVFVYGGGLNEWTTNGLPIEVGARNSGQFTNVTGAAASGKTEGSKQ
jgi:rhodanese-related sulfurtransferase